MVHWRIEILDCIESTQDIVKQRAYEGAEEGLVIQALQQRSGRGRQGRVWESPAGNLYLSLLLRPQSVAQDVGQLSLMVGAALACAIDEVCSVRPMLKWPNDVFVEGKKCAGILIESDLRADGSLDWLAVGFGVNVAHAPEMGYALSDFSDVDVETFRDVALAHIDRLYTLSFADVREIWLSYAHERGRVLSVLIDSQKTHGAFHDIDAAGNLLLDVNGEIKTISSGDVYLQDIGQG